MGMSKSLINNIFLGVNGPGLLFGVYSTFAYVNIVNELGQIVGRPIVYIVTDIFSRMITGVNVGLEGNHGVIKAIENARSDKTTFCAQYGIIISESDWPCHHLPHSIAVAKGEIDSKEIDYLTMSLGIRIESLTYHSNIKGLGERQFAFLNQELELWQPDIREELLKPGCLTVDEFTKCTILSIIKYNSMIQKGLYLENDMLADKVPPIPVKIWNWGRCYRSELLNW